MKSGVMLRCSSPRRYDGKPCRRRAGWGTAHKGEGRCKAHDEVYDEKLKASKKSFVDLVAGGQHTLRMAAQEAGASEASIWRWRRADPSFDHDVVQAAGTVAAGRLDAHEMSLFSRAMKGKLAAGLEIFWMLNMAEREAAMNQAGWTRWSQPASRHELTGKDGGPVQAEVTQQVLIYIPDNGRGDVPAGCLVDVTPKEVAGG